MASSKDERAAAAGYDRWAGFYDDNDPSTALDEPFLLKHLSPFAGCRILDLGCGTGRYLRQLTTSACRIVGVDLSRNMLARARQQLGSRRDVCLVQASANCLPFQSASFDRIMSGLVVDHLHSAEQFFREMSRILMAHGQAIVAAVHPHMQHLTGSDLDIRTAHGEPIQIPGHVHEVEHLLAAAHDAGMTVVAMEEPRVTASMLEQRPDWNRKLDRAALLLLALAKTKG